MSPAKRALWSLLAVGLFTSCEGPVALQQSLEFEMSPTQLWGVGEITLTSRSFDPMVLVPATDSSGGVIEHRWANFAVLLDDDTLDSWPVDDTTMVAAITRYSTEEPSIMSGRYTVTVVADGWNAGTAELELFGVRRHAELDVYPDLWKLPVPWGAGRVIAYTVDVLRDTLVRHVALIDLWKGSATTLSDVDGWPGILAPGASYDAERVVLDLDETVQPSVSYRVTGRLQPMDSLGCYPLGGGYLVAEVGPGRCLGWYPRGVPSQQGIWANGTTLLAEVRLPALGAFVISPDSRHTIPTMKDLCSSVFGPNASWWVFDDTPAVDYTLEGVGCVSGASFTPGGDTLFITARDPIVEGYPPPAWRVEARDVESGVLMASWMPDEDLPLFEILADPVLPWLYVQGVGELWVLARASLEVVARIPQPHFDLNVMVHGGAAGTLYVWSLKHAHGLYVIEYDILRAEPDRSNLTTRGARLPPRPSSVSTAEPTLYVPAREARSR